MEKRNFLSRVYHLLSQDDNECHHGDKEKGREIITLGEESVGSECDEESNTDEENEKPTAQTSSEWKAAFNIINFMTGVGFLAIPYAVKMGGIFALVSLVLMPMLHWYTGKILIGCLYKEDRLYGNKIRVRSTYREIGEVCLPRVGGILVDISVYSGIFLAPVSYFVLCGSLLSFALPSVPLTQTMWVLVTAAVVLPTTFFENLGQIAWMSTISLIAVLGTIAAIAWYGSLHISDWQISELLFWDTESAAVALGIVFFCYETHVVLTDMEESMRNRNNFGCALGCSYAFVAAKKVILAVFGFMTFGQSTNGVILHNLPAGPIRIGVSALFIVSMVLTFAIPLHALVHNLEHSKAVDNLMSRLPRLVWFAGIRLILFFLALLTAILLPHFAALSAFAGSLTVPLTSMIFPSLFHLRLKYEELNIVEIIADIVVILLGLFLGAITLYFSGKVLFVG